MTLLANTDAPEPVALIVAWGIYSLAALAYFGYQSAWLGTVCSVLR